MKIPESEISFQAIRAQGAGGQNVNKVSSAIHLRFNIQESSLNEDQQNKLLAYPDQRISSDGIIIIKAQRFRTQEKNRADAISRLDELIEKALKPRKKRKPTKPSKAAKKKRLNDKKLKSKVKSLRSKPTL